MSSELYLVNELNIDPFVNNIDCHRKKITNIIINPNNQLLSLLCYQNLLKLLPPLTNNCTHINANQNRIYQLDKLPNLLNYLNLSRNRLINTNFLNLHQNLTYINISHNFISRISILPPNLE